MHARVKTSTYTTKEAGEWVIYLYIDIRHTHLGSLGFQDIMHKEAFGLVLAQEIDAIITKTGSELETRVMIQDYETNIRLKRKVQDEARLEIMLLDIVLNMILADIPDLYEKAWKESLKIMDLKRTLEDVPLNIGREAD